MKITAVEPIALSLPMLLDADQPMQSGVARTTVDMLLVRVDTDAGISGWGEAFDLRAVPGTKAIIETMLAPFCIGRDATDIAGMHYALERSLLVSGRNGPARWAQIGRAHV